MKNITSRIQISAPALVSDGRYTAKYSFRIQGTIEYSHLQKQDQFRAYASGIIHQDIYREPYNDLMQIKAAVQNGSEDVISKIDTLLNKMRGI